MDEFVSLGARPLGISIAADYQAQHLMDHQIGYELLLDPNGTFKSATLSVERLRLRDLLSPKAAWRYIKWIAKARPGRPTAPPSEPPAVAIIDRHGIIRFVHRGETLGDYPPIELVMNELRKLGD